MNTKDPMFTQLPGSEYEEPTTAEKIADVIALIGVASLGGIALYAVNYFFGVI